MHFNVVTRAYIQHVRTFNTCIHSTYGGTFNIWGYIQHVRTFNTCVHSTYGGTFTTCVHSTRAYIQHMGVHSTYGGTFNIWGYILKCAHARVQHTVINISWAILCAVFENKQNKYWLYDIFNFTSKIEHRKQLNIEILFLSSTEPCKQNTKRKILNIIIAARLTYS